MATLIRNTHHLNDLHFCLNSQVVEEDLEVLLHLDRVVLELRHGEDSQLAVLPGTVLAQQEGQQHQQTAVMHNPPHVNEAADLKRKKKNSNTSIVKVVKK
jgi:hypothetical protein